ncbi:MAG: FAD-binding oxidoreductase [Actinomycetota bacterium]|nr:FAD-binding oxidoreductase [Actinomycetota bacterium]
MEEIGRDEVPYWLEGPRSRYPRLAADERVDVAVVGGGVTGLSCARVLASSGLAVRVLEARRVASGASGRNGGFALRGFARPYAAVRAPELMRLTEEGLDRVAALAGDAFRPSGSLSLAESEAELELVRSEHDALRADGFAVEWVEREKLPSSLSPHYLGGLFHPTDGLLDPGRWGARLAELAVAAGVAVAEESPSVAVEGGGVVVASGKTVAADHVVVATDGYTRGLLPDVDRVLACVRNQVLATARLPRRLFECAVYARYGYDYWQQTRDGRLVLGGRRDADPDAEATQEEGTSETIQLELERLLARLLGEAADVTHRWSGLLAFTPDRLPLVGALPGRDAVSVSVGYSGHGNVLALACGEGLGRAILGDADPRLAAFNPERILDARRRA